MEKFPTNTILAICLIVSLFYLIEKVITPSLTLEEPIAGIDYPINFVVNGLTKEMAVVKVQIIMMGDDRDISSVTYTTKSMIANHFRNDTMFYDTLGHSIMKKFDGVQHITLLPQIEKCSLSL